MEMYTNEMYRQPLDVLGLPLRRCLQDGLSHFFKSLETTGQGEAGCWAEAAQRFSSQFPRKRGTCPGLGREGSGRAEGTGKDLEICGGPGKIREQLRVLSRGSLTSSSTLNLEGL